MNDAKRDEIWSILNEAFEGLHRLLQTTVPGVKVDAGHHHNDAFWFRSYAEFSANSHVVVLSFNIQMKGSQIHVWGDIARENGAVLMDIIDVTRGVPMDGVNDLVQLAQQFADGCKREIGLLEIELK